MSGSLGDAGRGAGSATEVWAAFDFDGTLTRRDSLLPFLHLVAGGPRLLGALGLEAPWLAAYAAGRLSNEQAKVRVLRRTLRGMSQQELRARAAEYAAGALPRLIRPPMLRRLRRHQELGHRCVLVTASPSLYTELWAQAHGFAATIGSVLEFSASGQATGELVEGNCWGPEKQRRLLRLLPPMAELAYAYGDTRGDREMLGMARHAFLLGAHNAHGARLPEL